MAPLDVAPEYATECLLSAAPASVRAARSLVRRELSMWGAHDLVDDCVLIVSELVTNAIRHGGAACALRIRGGEGFVHGELFDPGAGTPRVRVRDMEATGGRGLQIVGSLADDWGVTHPAAGGKTVWFVLTLPGPFRRPPMFPVPRHSGE
ncbi:anti-sigma regulatory factor (Ser/Thr protein kinase) [Streptosporangium becharense]|uniref:Anti-sigma regulatory factor (Ser/Thr protein kinase) n=1 Tax=Streptosporangium becharense TaxID=1816182 RepID=A0A7W9IJA9_9ACTN|nr:ATP-binding protein [Streptosporangium becharense]MBB2911316.1 anti-sigma regulatory factor (Ser/Thr protein kinase) [Streptosporangium becharense]MBB5821626.1 anti-sigma regulatory factor (Ser/Thr protein kinase) [Streptosporangium becharense]